MDTVSQKLKHQIEVSAGNVQYTYIAHWIIVNRLKSRNVSIKVTQIILTALSTGGFLASMVAGVPWLCWIGGFTSALALGLNLYSLNFNLPAEIKSHMDAANSLWDIRESYKDLITDFDELSNEQIREKRNEITKDVSRINKMYPGTDDKAFKKAQKHIPDYMFEEGEAAKIINYKGEENDSISE